jgi:hypothetical protein
MFSLFDVYAFYLLCLISNTDVTSEFKLFSENPFKNLQLIFLLPLKDVVSIILIIER